MKRIKVKITANNNVGLKKGDVKNLMPDVANKLIADGGAEFVEAVEYAGQTSQEELVKRVEGLEKRIVKLEKRKK